MNEKRIDLPSGDFTFTDSPSANALSQQIRDFEKIKEYMENTGTQGTEILVSHEEVKTILNAMKAINQLKWRRAEEWHEDIGFCFWTKLPVSEPYYSGSPLCNDWRDGYYTHFIPMGVFDVFLDKNGNIKNDA